MANVTGLTVETLESEEGPALGAAMLAAVGCGYFSSVAQAAQTVVKISERIKPDKETMAKYQEKYQKFKQFYPALKNLF